MTGSISAAVTGTVATGLAGVAANTDSYIYQPITGTLRGHLAVELESPLRTAITPDGATMFIAGDAGVAVVPAPN